MFYLIILSCLSLCMCTSAKVATNLESIAHYNEWDIQEAFPSVNVKNTFALNYVFIDAETTWLDAFATCNSMRGKLVTPSNPTLDNGLRTYVIGAGITEQFWIGGRVSAADDQNQRVWFWETTNVGVLWTNFHPSPTCGLVEEDFCLAAYLNTNNGAWGWCRRPCRDNLGYICEFGTPPPTTTTTTVNPTDSTDVSYETTEYVTNPPTKETTTVPTPTEIPDPTTEPPQTTIIITRTTLDDTTTKSYFQCPIQNGLYADPEDCARFYSCLDGEVVEHFTCPDGLFWNPNLANCDHPWNVDCAVLTTTTINYTTTTNITTRTPETTTIAVTTTTDASNFVCPFDNGQFGDPTDCAKYYVCEGGLVVAHKSCPKFYLWSHSAKKCVDASDSDCDINRFK